MNSITSPLNTSDFARLAQNAQALIKTLEASKSDTSSIDVKADKSAPSIARQKYEQAYDKTLYALKSRSNELSYYMQERDTFDIAHLKNAKIYLDLNGDGDLRDSERINAFNLATLDTSGDGVVGSSDKFYKKLTVSFEDKDGVSHEVRLADLIDQIALKDFVDKDKADEAKKIFKAHQDKLKKADKEGESIDYIAHQEYYSIKKNGKTFYKIDKHGENFIYDSRPYVPRLDYRVDMLGENGFKKASSSDLDTLFQKTDREGWVNLQGSEALGINSEFYNLGYTKLDANAQLRFQAFNPNDAWADGQMRYREWLENPKEGVTYEDKVAKKFETWLELYRRAERSLIEENEALYKELQGSDLGSNELESIKLFTSDWLEGLKEHFKQLTGMEFSQENLSAAREAVEKGKSVERFADHDKVVALKQDKLQGGYWLKFDSGRIIKADELFFQNDKTLKDATTETSTGIIDAQKLHTLLQGQSLYNYRA